MKLVNTEFDGLFLVENFYQKDNRGSFTKVFSNEIFKQTGINFSPKEIYFSISNKDVIRGMHFQVPPMDHAKLVYVASGSIIDVLLDIRKQSKTFGKNFSVKLEANIKSIFIPSGFAHGFKSLEDNTTVIYNQTTIYSKENDSGILWNSFGYDWNIDNPTISDRDKSFEHFNNFLSPF